MSDRLEKIKELRAKDYEGYRTGPTVLDDIDYLLSLLDRPVSQEAQTVAQQIAVKYLGHLSVSTKRTLLAADITTALQSHADAARPKVSEDDEEAAIGLIEGICAHVGMTILANDGELTALVARTLIRCIAQDRASVRDAARLERDEIINAVLGKVGKRWRSMSIEDAGNVEINGPTAAIVADQPGAALVAVEMALTHLEDAARLAERQRIRGAVEKMRVEVLDTGDDYELSQVEYNVLVQVLAAIDGQPVDGG